MSSQPIPSSSKPYPLPEGLEIIPDHLLDLRPDPEIDHDFARFSPVSDEKNIWFFWDSGYEQMHPYTKRTVRAWHRRFSKKGWIIRVMDRVPGSSSNIANYLDLNDPDTVPRAFADGTLGGTHARQHMSDLIRWPLLLKYGGLWADVALIQIGDLDHFWNKTIDNPSSPFEVLGYGSEGSQPRELTNYFWACKRNNPLFARCHKLFLKLWAEDGGKLSQEGMCRSPLLKGVPLVGGKFDADSDEKVRMSVSDYMIQGLVTMMVMGLVDEEDGWNGPEYVAQHVYAIEYKVGCTLYNEMTAWNGTKQFELMSLPLPLPAEGEEESADQKLAREIVEASLQKGFGFKLAQGFIVVQVLGETLGSLWRAHEGSDNVPGTYAHWLRHGSIYWIQKHYQDPPLLDYRAIEPVKRGRLLESK